MKTNDPRERPLIDAMRKIVGTTNYDPNYANVGERELVETKLFLARMDALTEYYRTLTGFRISDTGDLIPVLLPTAPEPVPIILWCPKCAVQHIDAAEDHKHDCISHTINAEGIRNDCSCGTWQNPPHRSHLCSYCGHVWRPADIPTTGVKEISTVGDRDDPAPVRGVIDKIARFDQRQPRWRHKRRQTVFTEVGRGAFENSGELSAYEGIGMIAYQDAMGKFWFRLEKEFDDGRFEVMSPNGDKA